MAIDCEPTTASNRKQVCGLGRDRDSLTVDIATAEAIRICQDPDAYRNSV